jgi:hypothetical protein
VHLLPKWTRRERYQERLWSQADSPDRQMDKIVAHASPNHQGETIKQPDRLVTINKYGGASHD